ncbi:hypothetical protein DY245_42030 [Streptomyces inhibens]|uniref:Uncharacterized protein n=1 Tax=Streptomyces inhibens TaxID=2293571 RepID=A0A371PQ45_STRIH|nr:hypothetical protein [Streptomyces inhibens]REK84644.1 hypothetical protein DY245_42030 [Streptomyces inhibens]
MARLVRQQELQVRVAYHSFALQESDDASLAVPYPDESEFGKYLNVFPGRLDFYSAGHTHTATVAVQVWDGPPPAADADEKWEESEEAVVDTASGELAVWGMQRADDVVVLGDAGGRWGVRVGSAGRSEVQRVTEDVGVAHGVERWLMQFWPEAE